MVVFMAGNLNEGYKCYGPFHDYDPAFQFADECGLDGWVMTLNDPTELCDFIKNSLKKKYETQEQNS